MKSSTQTCAQTFAVNATLGSYLRSHSAQAGPFASCCAHFASEPPLPLLAPKRHHRYHRWRWRRHHFASCSEHFFSATPLPLRRRPPPLHRHHLATPLPHLHPPPRSHCHRRHRSWRRLPIKYTRKHKTTNERTCRPSNKAQLRNNIQNNKKFPDRSCMLSTWTHWLLAKSGCHLTPWYFIALYRQWPHTFAEADTAIQKSWLKISSIELVHVLNASASDQHTAAVFQKLTSCKAPKIMGGAYVKMSTAERFTLWHW